MTDIERLIEDLRRSGSEGSLAWEAAAQLRADHPEGGTRSTSDNEWVTAFWKQVRENNAKLDALMAGYRAERAAPIAPEPEAVEALTRLAQVDAAELLDARQKVREAQAGVKKDVSERRDSIRRGARRSSHRARETEALGLYDDSTKPDYAAQAEAVDEMARAKVHVNTRDDIALCLLHQCNAAALSAAAATLRAVPGMVAEYRRLLSVTRNLIAESSDPGTEALAAVHYSDAALRALEDRKEETTPK